MLLGAPQLWYPMRLKEGFYVKNPEGNRVGFGKKLLDHLDNDHLKSDADARKQRLMFAVKAVTDTSPRSA